MGHSHYCGWISEEGYRFAKGVVNGKLSLIRIVTEPEGFKDISFEVAIPEDFTDVSAEIYYLLEAMEYDENSKMTKEWQGVKAEIYDNIVRGNVPEGACC